MPNESVKERSVTGYLKPCNNSFFKKYVENAEISKSEGINDAVRALKELNIIRSCMPPEDLKKILGKNGY